MLQCKQWYNIPYNVTNPFCVIIQFYISSCFSTFYHLHHQIKTKVFLVATRQPRTVFWRDFFIMQRPQKTSQETCEVPMHYFFFSLPVTCSKRKGWKRKEKKTFNQTCPTLEDEILEEITSYAMLQKLYRIKISFSVPAHFLEHFYLATSRDDRIIDYAELERGHKDHRVQLLALVRWASYADYIRKQKSF